MTKRKKLHRSTTKQSSSSSSSSPKLPVEALPPNTKQPRHAHNIYNDRDPETNQYVVYSRAQSNAFISTGSIGNKDFLLTINAFRYIYLSKNITPEWKSSIRQCIYEQYIFFRLDQHRALEKISKAVEDPRRLNLKKLSEDRPLIEERTNEWVREQNLPLDYFITAYDDIHHTRSEMIASGILSPSSTSFTSINKVLLGTTDSRRATSSTATGTHTDTQNQLPDYFIPRQDRQQSQYLHEFSTWNESTGTDADDSTNTNTYSNTNYYIEELAYHYCYDQAALAIMNKNNNNQQQQLFLKALPPPPPIPLPPQTDGSDDDYGITWTYDPNTRIYLVDFTNVPPDATIPLRQKLFVGQLMERDDITVICEGLYDHSKFNNHTTGTGSGIRDTMNDFLHDLACNFSGIPYTKFRQFNRIVTKTKIGTTEYGSDENDIYCNENDTTEQSSINETYMTTYEEVDGYRTMNVMTEYIPYLQKIQSLSSLQPPPHTIHSYDHRQASINNSDSQATAVVAGVAVATTVTECTTIHDGNDEEMNYNGYHHKTNDNSNTHCSTTTAGIENYDNNDTMELKSNAPKDEKEGDRNNTDEHSSCCIYMTDVEMTTYCPRFDYEYKQSFKMKELLPGGTWCLMNHLPEQSRPFMGPNLYISPGGGYTQFHQDGHGTVDSGHSCLSGYNEVVMLRRLPECHKRQACQLIPSSTSTKRMTRNNTDKKTNHRTIPERSRGGPSTVDADLMTAARQNQAENVLYRLPHDDFRDDKLIWAQTSTIEEWEKLGYCPSVFILKPGQHLLINKGRLHAFRKMTFDELPENDCHSQLRKNMVAELRAQNINRPPLCVSVAFDWSFTGITAEGINRELATTLESAALCRKYKTCKSLAIPETAVLRMAAKVPIDVHRDNIATHLGSNRTEYVLSWWQIIRGILPSLRYIVRRDNFKLGDGHSKKILISEFPDVHPNAEQNGIDPYGNDYFCNICSHELANAYFHCDGCESLLAKDFNICIDCYNDGAYAINVEMHKWGGTTMACHHHHVGMPKLQCTNPTTHNSKCIKCDKCLFCNCKCHTIFQERQRFYAEAQQHHMLDRCTELVQGFEIKYSVETESQLLGKPLISVDCNQLTISEKGDVRPTDSTTRCIVADSTQRERQSDLLHTGDDTCNVKKEIGMNSSELKTPSHSVEAIDIEDDDDVPTAKDDDAAQSEEVLNSNTGEIRNVDPLDERHQTEFISNADELQTETTWVETSHSTAILDTSPVVNIYNYSASPVSDSSTGSVVRRVPVQPVCALQSFEFDAV